MKTFQHCVNAAKIGSQQRGRKSDVFTNQINGDLVILKQMSRGLWPGTVQYRDIKNYYGLTSRSVIGAIPQLQDVKRQYLAEKRGV